MSDSEPVYFGGDGAIQFILESSQDIQTRTATNYLRPCMLIRPSCEKEAALFTRLTFILVAHFKTPDTERIN